MHHSQEGGFLLLLSLEVIEEDTSLLALLAPILDHDARAIDNFSGIPFTIEHT